MIKCLKSLSPTVVVFIVLVAVSFFYMQQSQKLKTEIVELKEKHTAERLATAIAHKAELQRQAALNDELTQQLIDKQHDITKQLQKLESSIDDAIKKDGAAYNGIGADSLCIYKRAFGYDCK